MKIRSIVLALATYPVDQQEKVVRAANAARAALLALAAAAPAPARKKRGPNKPKAAPVAAPKAAKKAAKKSKKILTAEDLENS